MSKKAKPWDAMRSGDLADYHGSTVRVRECINDSSTGVPWWSCERVMPADGKLMALGETSLRPVDGNHPLCVPGAKVRIVGDRGQPFAGTLGVIAGPSKQGRELVRLLEPDGTRIEWWRDDVVLTALAPEPKATGKTYAEHVAAQINAEDNGIAATVEPSPAVVHVPDVPPEGIQCRCVAVGPGMGGGLFESTTPDGEPPALSPGIIRTGGDKARPACPSCGETDCEPVTPWWRRHPNPDVDRSLCPEIVAEALDPREAADVTGPSRGKLGPMHRNTADENCAKSGVVHLTYMVIAECCTEHGRTPHQMEQWRRELLAEPTDADIPDATAEDRERAWARECDAMVRGES